ncbi:MAG: hypothetical protein L7U83_10050 [Akkermansiaceae bacterium]|jgi:hypothetical protein|nr:hypothetical protein [bacterium]MCH1499397.1 hypothetical protein [Akkermansiaceae bacterium]RZN89027.1 MAG: hypothetical protein EVB10_04010 [Verrucomicrobiaceae bacterium]HAN82661.1 hypothetical protein [Verrucomicrobiales bacterium]HBF17478.1 hypothetical protein [Verrucomicrobiales bacterium]|tara:strand:+ start:222 stop:617 length:396 start_codon:yes stop_codon:yes gene_type:complete
MARRASSGVNTGALIIGAIVFILVLGGGYWFLNRKPSGFDAPELDIEQALSNSRSLSGNRYQVTGKLIDRNIESNGQIITIQLGEETNPKFLPIIIPEDFKNGNLNQQSQYTFLIQFNTVGLAVAEDVKQL